MRIRSGQLPHFYRSIAVFAALFVPAHAVFADGPDPSPSQAPSSSLQCGRDHASGKFAILTANFDVVGDNEFSSETDCETAIQTGNPDLVCTVGAKSGGYGPYSVSGGKIVSSYYFGSLADCVHAIQGIKEGLICSPGPDANTYEAYDLTNARSASRFFFSGLQTCKQALGSAEVQASRNAEIRKGDVENCDNVRMDQPGGSMEHVAVRDQGQLPICFAEVAAEVADAWRFSKGDGNYDLQTSALIAALQAYNVDGDSELDEGEQPQDALAQIVKNGACSKAATLESQNQDDVMDFIAELKDIRRRAQGSPQIGTLQPDEVTAIEKFNENSCLMTSGAVAGFDSLIQQLQESDPRRIFLNLLSVPCQGDNLVKVPPVEITNPVDPRWESPLEIANYISDHVRSATQMPLPVAICGKVFGDPKYRVVLAKPTAFSDNADDCQDSLHAMLVIGKRVNPSSGRCEFLVRNSWGEDCANSADHFTCEHGSVWMDADILARNMVEVGAVTAGVPK